MEAAEASSSDLPKAQLCDPPDMLQQISFLLMLSRLGLSCLPPESQQNTVSVLAQWCLDLVTTGDQELELELYS